MITKTGTILVVDDNRNILSALELLLSRHFARVVAIPSPNRLTVTLREETIDVVLLDMNFSTGINNGNEGLFWFREIKRYDPSIPVVLFTAYADYDLAVTAIKEGAYDFVVKPWDNLKLISTLKAAYKSSGKKEVADAVPDSVVSAEDTQINYSTLDQMEKDMIRGAMVRSGGNLSSVAAQLGITRQTLYNKIKKYGL